MNKDSYIVIAVPMKEEYEAFLSQVNENKSTLIIDGIEGTTFNISNHKIFAYISGIGRVSSAFTLGKLSSSINIKLIVNLGTSGSLSNKVKPLDVVIATSVSYLDVDLTTFGYKYGQMSSCPSTFESSIVKNIDVQGLKDINVHKGLVLTADSFMTDNSPLKEKLDLFNNPLAIDMEGGGVAQVAYKLNVPFVVVRSISDSVSSKDNTKMHEEMVNLSTKIAAKVFLAAINQI